MERSITPETGVRNITDGGDFANWDLPSDHQRSMWILGWGMMDFTPSTDERQGFDPPSSFGLGCHKRDVDSNSPVTSFHPNPNFMPRTPNSEDLQHSSSRAHFDEPSANHAPFGSYFAAGKPNYDDSTFSDNMRIECLTLRPPLADRQSLSDYQSTATSNDGSDDGKHPGVSQFRDYGVLGTQAEQESSGSTFDTCGNEHRGTSDDQPPDDTHDGGSDKRSDEEYRKHLSRRRHRYGHNEERFGNTNDEENDEGP